MDTVAPRISIERQMKNLVSAMTSLITASNAVPMNVSDKIESKDMNFNPKVVSHFLIKHGV